MIREEVGLSPVTASRLFSRDEMLDVDTILDESCIRRS